MRSWSVGGALIADSAGRLLLVANRRRDDSVDWSPPGGVIEEGEPLLEGLTREVAEETGLLVTRWAPAHYSVTVDAPDLGWVLSVSAHVALEWSGELTHDDPDGIVHAGEFVDAVRAEVLLATARPWVRDPVTQWLADQSHIGHDYHYEIVGAQRSDADVVRHR
jgi:8-oxo-dGTP diphosphatase